MNKEQARVSKFLSLVLRHRPEMLGISLQAGGWVAVEELLRKMSEKGNHLDFDKLQVVVDTNDKAFRFQRR